jgi:hypothetical protein
MANIARCGEPRLHRNPHFRDCLSGVSPKAEHDFRSGTSATHESSSSDQNTMMA